RHAGGPGAAARRRERAARPAGRPRGARRSNSRRDAGDRRRRARDIQGARERAGPWRTLAQPDRIAPVRPRVLLWTAMAAYAAGFASLSILRHRAFNTG